VIRGLSLIPSYRDHAHPPSLRPEYIQALYQLLKDVHDAMDICQVPYWIEAGTLLGAIRHGGFIPWDDDIDIQVEALSQNDLVEKVLPLLAHIGYKIDAFPDEGGFKIFMTSSQFHKEESETFPACDILFAREKQKGALSIWGSNKVMYLKNIYPLRIYGFGPLRVWGPGSPLSYLDHCYGRTWRLLAKRGNDHVTNGKGGGRSYFQIQDFSPGLPLRPLIDHKEIMKKFMEIKEIP
jgi:lipopolysaccharide cholinephosphotransferase